MNRLIINKEVLSVMDQIADHINTRCKELKMTKGQLACKLGMSRGTISRITTEPYTAANLSTYIEIAKALGINEVTLKW